jgi:ribosomal-protein-alanine N-acetyltransferase
MRTLHGEGVTLEPQLESHAGELYPVLADPALYTFTDDKEPASEAAFRERLRRLESRASPDGTQHWLNWIVRNDAGDAVGYVQATIFPDHSAEVAYVIGRAFWRRGYAAAAMLTVLEELRQCYGVDTARATLDPGNAASLALLRRLGFELAATEETANEVAYARKL